MLGLSHGGANIYTGSAPSNEVLVGTRDGVVRLERDGEWQVTHRSLPDRFISSIVVEPESGLVFAGAWHGSVHRSGDGGRTWEQCDNGLPLDDVWSLAATRQGGRVRIFLGTGPAHLFVSDDLGDSWRELPGMRDVPSVDKWSFFANPAHTKFISFDPNDPYTVYSCIEQGSFLKSTDGGDTWRELNAMSYITDKNRPWDLFYDCHKTVIDPRDPDRIFVSGGAGLYVTADGGKQWEHWMIPDWAKDVYPDALVLNPRHPDVMLLGAAEHNPMTWHKSRFAGGKIYRSTDGGRNWEWLTNGLPKEPMRQEIAALCLEDWGASFSVFAATTGGEVYWSEDGGDSWSLIADGMPPVSKWRHYRTINAGRFVGLPPINEVVAARM